MNKYAVIMKNEYGYTMVVVEAQSKREAHEQAECYHSHLGEVVGVAKLDE